MLLPANLLFAEWVFLFHFQSSLPNAGEHVSCIYCWIFVSTRAWL